MLFVFRKLDNSMFRLFDITNLEVYVRQQFKGLSVETDILHHLRVMHVVRKIRRWRKVAESHHLFGAVNDHRLVDVRVSFNWCLLEYNKILLQSKSWHYYY